MTTDKRSSLDLLKVVHEDAGGLAQIFGGRIPEYINSLWTGVALALGDGPLEYFDGSVSNEVGGLGADLVFYSTHAVIRATANPSQAARVWTFRRSDLQTVGVSGGIGFFGDDAFGSWPGRVAITATYPTEQVTLPASETDSASRRRLLDFLPSLLADLNCGK